MNKRRLIDDLAPEMKTMLDNGEDILFTVTGISMQPMLYNKRDKVVLSKPNFPLKKHQIPFYHFQNKKWLMHRIVKTNKDGTYTCRGDNRWDCEKNVSEEQIIGVVSGFYRNGKYIDVNTSIGYFIYCRAWFILHYFKFLYKYFYNAKSKLRNLLQNIFKPKVFKFVAEDGKMKNLIFRKAKISDINQLAKLHYELATFEEETLSVDCYDAEWIYTEMGFSFVKNLIEKSYVNVAEYKGMLVAYCRGSILNSESQKHPVGKLSNIYVLPEYRKFGIGSELVKQIKEYCKANGCKSISVTFYCNNEKARNFYKKHGFVCLKETQNCKLGD